MMSPRPDPAARQRHAVHILAQLLREHPDLPVIDWTVSQHGLHAHLYLCHADPYDQRQAFTAWTTTLGLAHGRDPGHGFLGASEIRAHRVIDGVLVILTATVHPF
jgi:hypothetical protein